MDTGVPKGGDLSTDFYTVILSINNNQIKISKNLQKYTCSIKIWNHKSQNHSKKWKTKINKKKFTYITFTLKKKLLAQYYNEQLSYTIIRPNKIFKFNIKLMSHMEILFKNKNKCSQLKTPQTSSITKIQTKSANKIISPQDNNKTHLVL